jgi:hypothetical protein
MNAPGQTESRPAWPLPASARPLRVLHLNAGNLFRGVETFLVTLARRRALCPQLEPAFGLCFPGRLEDELTSADFLSEKERRLAVQEIRPPSCGCSVSPTQALTGSSNLRRHHRRPITAPNQERDFAGS